MAKNRRKKNELSLRRPSRFVTAIADIAVNTQTISLANTTYLKILYIYLKIFSKTVTKTILIFKIFFLISQNAIGGAGGRVGGS